MTTLDQVLHVARKDIRVVRWYLAAYVGLLLIGAYATLAHPGNAVFTPALFSILVAWLMIGVAVQSDNVTRADAFWVTRPLGPLSMYGAKLLLAGAVVALGLIVQTVIMAAHDAAARSIWSAAGNLVLWFGSLMITGVLVGALTRNAHGFVGGTLGLLLLMQLPAIVVSSGAPPEELGPWYGIVTAAIWLTALLVLGAWQYRRRDLRRGRAALIVVLLLGMLPAFVPHRDTDAGASAVELSGRIHSGVGSMSGRQQVRLHAELPSDESGTVRSLLISRTAHMRWTDGREETVSIAQRGEAWRGVVNDQAYTSLFAEDMPLAFLHLTATQFNALRAGSATVVVEGYVMVQRQIELAVLELDDARVHVAHGVRTRIDGANTVPGRYVAVSMTGVTGSPGVGGFDYNDVVFSLVSPATADTLLLGQQSGVSSRGTLALPSARGWHRGVSLSLAPSRDETEARQWPDDARLRVTAWRTEDRYRVRITAGLAVEETPTPFSEPRDSAAAESSLTERRDEGERRQAGS